MRSSFALGKGGREALIRDSVLVEMIGHVVDVGFSSAPAYAVSMHDRTCYRLLHMWTAAAEHCFSRTKYQQKSFMILFGKQHTNDLGIHPHCHELSMPTTLTTSPAN
jgi:hypothetical protein